ncbi:TELO2-interacting protein 1 [Aphelenchoides avenae]|nr:TELO2-interacting protein 1 [Aphelenchus avenae]
MLTVFATVLDNLRTAVVERQVAYAIFFAALLHSLREKDLSDGTMLSYVKSCLAECTELLEGLDGIEPDVKDEAVEDVSQSHSDESCLAMALLLSTGLSAALLKSDPRCSKHLVNALYDLLKWCGTTTFAVRESAENALELIARSTSASVPSMLSAHAPLITYKVSLACKDYRRNPRAPVVLSELLNRCEESTVFAQVQHIVPELLLALDRNDQKKTTLILRALRSFVRAMHRWFPELKPAPVDDTVPGCSTAVDDDDEEQEEEESAVMEEKKTAPPAQIRTVVDVLNRTKHMISSPHLPVQLLVLDILDASLRVVRHFENELLPMIHQNWLGLVHKFGAGWSLDLSDQRKLVAARAVEVAETMAELSGSFIYHKVTKEFTPKVTEFLRRSMQSSEGTGKVYTHTATYKYQLAILRSLPTFVEKCGLTKKDRAPLLEALGAYAASPKQAPSLLQQAAQSLEQCRRFSK